MTAADQALRALIAEAGGAVSFEQFMAFALYDPHFGYYTSRVETVGRRGDFSTTPTVHPALARAIARWAVAQQAQVRQSSGAWHLIELGGGSGETAAGVLAELGWWGRRGLRYEIVEIGAGLRALQQRRLAASGRQVTWHDGIASALRAAGGRALIFSNEFVDAFPCVWLARGAMPEVWREIGLQWPPGGERPQEILMPWTRPANLEASALDDLGSEASSAQQRVEIHVAYRRWMDDLERHWLAGRLLTIDYGEVWPNLYRRRPSGTVRAYCRQMRLEGREIYERVGRQDLTADVNFTDLRQWGRALGWAEEWYGSQSAFLRTHLPTRAIDEAWRDPVLVRLLDPEDAGGALQVLEERRVS